ncbi:unnamed protein product [Merluccius merluccius]
MWDRMVSVLFLLLGAAWNSFNLLATLGQQRVLQPASLIVCLISSSNTMLDVTTLAMQVVLWELVLHQERLPLYFQVLTMVWLGASAVSFWSVAWLSTLYCVTVVRSSSPLLLAAKRNAEVVVHTGLALVLVFSSLMFLPFLCIQYRHNLCSTHTSLNPITLNATKASQNLSPLNSPQNFTENFTQNLTENVTCISSMIQFPVQLNSAVYLVFLICYLILLPLCTMLLTSLHLVIYLYNHVLSVRANHGEFGGSESYLLVCGVTVALVSVFVTTLLMIFFYYIQAIFSSRISADFLFYTFSYYCTASAALLSASNRSLRERMRTLLCRPNAIQETSAP